MKTLFAAALLAALAPTLQAAPAAAPDPADPAAAVPRPHYRSVFSDTPTGVEQEAVPWNRANAEVARFPRGHIDLLKWEQGQAGKSAPAAAPPSTAATTSAPAAPAAQAEPAAPAVAPAPDRSGHHRH